MPLLSLWKSDPTSINEFTVEQVVATAGTGDLKDGSACSQELRSFLSQVPTPKIAQYVDHCLTIAFSRGGMVLQDLINELGRRLDYQVENGRYQGTTKDIGFDGIWQSPEHHSIVVEVKTTDAYRISLDTIAGYREKLGSTGRITGPSSILIIVGRDDTGELEAQVRGSRHAWDIRLISAEALLKLVQLKENAEDTETGRKIRSLLTPREYTRLDQMIDVMFTTATDVEPALRGGLEPDDEGAGIPDAGAAPPAVRDANSGKGTWEFTDGALLQSKRTELITALADRLGVPLIKRTRALYWDAAHEVRVASSISKRYAKRGSYPYWYAYHPQWDEFLRGGRSSYFALGCMDLAVAFAIPWETLNPVLPALNTTTTDRTIYWHVHIVETSPGDYALLLPKQGQSMPLRPFEVALGRNPHLTDGDPPPARTNGIVPRRAGTFGG